MYTRVLMTASSGSVTVELTVELSTPLGYETLPLILLNFVDLTGKFSPMFGTTSNPPPHLTHL